VALRPTRAIIEGTGEGIPAAESVAGSAERHPLGNTFLPWLGTDMWRNPPALALPGLFAEIGLEFRLLGWTLVLALLVGGGIVVILWTRNWWQRPAHEGPAEPTLDDYRKLLDAGILDPQEFERIRAHLEPTAEPPELRHGIQDPQLRTGIRREPPESPPPGPAT